MEIAHLRPSWARAARRFIGLSLVVALTPAFLAVGAGPVNAATGDMVVFSQPSSRPDAYLGAIVLGPDGNGWATAGSGGVARISIDGAIDYFPAPSDRALPLTSIVSAADGALWYASYNNHLTRVTIDGDFERFSVGSTVHPTDVATAPDGSLWVTSGRGGGVGVFQYDIFEGTITQFIPLNGNTHNPAGITVTADGSAWFAIPQANQIGRVTPEGDLTLFSDPAGLVAWPSEVVAGADGNVWFTSPGNGRVGRITPDGWISTFGGFRHAASGIALGPDGNIWITEALGNPRVAVVARVTPDGTVSEFDTPDGVFPGGITTGPGGTLWFTAGTSARTDMVGQVTVLNASCGDSPPPNGFVDVSTVAPYGPGLDWAACHHIATAASDGRYRPENALKRGQLADMLWDMFDRPGGSPPAGFADVANAAPYRRGVDWVAAEGAIAGFADGFHPNEALNRRQLVKALWALVGEPDGVPAHGFTDVPPGAAYGAALDWAAAHGVDGSFSDSLFGPNKPVKRGQVAAILNDLAGDQTAWAAWSGSDVSTWRF